jgi:ABC-type phosphate transport system substrate-binding protein
MSGVRGFGLKCLVCALMGLASGATSASAEESTGLGGVSSSPLEGQLVVSGSQSLLGVEAARDAEEAGR